MECNRTRDEDLAGDKMELLYGEADRETRARVEAHLGECPACRDEMNALRRLRGDLHAWTTAASESPVLHFFWLPTRIPSCTSVTSASHCQEPLHPSHELFVSCSRERSLRLVKQTWVFVGSSKSEVQLHEDLHERIGEQVPDVLRLTNSPKN